VIKRIIITATILNPGFIANEKYLRGMQKNKIYEGI
jgi:hypothetical protein